MSDRNPAEHGPRPESPMSEDRFRALCLMYHGDEIDAASFASLCAELDAHAERRTLFVEVSMQVEAVYEVFELKDAEQTAVELGISDDEDDADEDAFDLMTMVVDQALAQRRQHELEEEANRQLAAQQAEDARNRRFELRHQGEFKPTRRQIVIPQVVVWLGFAAVLMFSALMIYKLTPPSPTHTPSKSTANQPTPNQTDTRPVVVATVTGALDATWQNGQAVSGGEAIYNQSYDLASGIIQLALTNGVTLTIEGPARVAPESEMLVALESGKLVGFVPEQAHGFTIRTETMKVVDLGTEFAVEVASMGGGDRVQVLGGSVLLQSATRFKAFEPAVAVAGDALRIGAAGALETVQAEPNRYYRWVPTSYERMIRDTDPLAYWRFETLDTAGQVIGLGRSSTTLGGLETADLSAEPTPATGAGDRSLWLEDTRRSINNVEPMELDLEGGWTIEAWVWVPSDTNRRMRIVSNNRLSENNQHAGGVGLGVSGRREDRIRGGPVLHFTGYAVFDAYSTTPVPTDRWAHVSVSLDEAGTLRMTIDGRPVSHQVRKLNHINRVPGGRAGELQARPGNDTWLVAASNTQDATQHEHWVGGIDELAIYSRVLTDEEIAEHSVLD